MQTRILLSFLLFTSSVLYGQQQIPASPAKKNANYVLYGMRHGVSYFPEVRYSHVQYETGDTLLFDKYHSADVIYDWLERWAEKIS